MHNPFVCDQIIIVKFNEIFLKKKNQHEFVKCLVKNIHVALSGLQFHLTAFHDHLEIQFVAAESSALLAILSKIPGIHHFVVAYVCATDLNALQQKANLFTKKVFKRFKIEVKRRYKNFVSQTVIKNHLARYIMQNNVISVDVHNPDLTIYVEIASAQKSYVYFTKYLGANGLPVGSSGKCLALLSGGIDSPVAAAMMQTKGLHVDYVHFYSSNTAEFTLHKIQSLVQAVSLEQKLCASKLYLVNYDLIQQELAHTTNPKYKITLMRRSFYRLASKLASQHGYGALVSGDSLGQVASQTLESLHTISAAADNLLIFRPLLALNKLEIIQKAIALNTYELSLKKDEDLCALFAPANPITKPHLKTALHLEQQLSLLEAMEAKALDKVQLIENFR